MKGVLFEDPRFDQYDQKVKELLKGFRKMTTLDIACGYGRLAKCFSSDLYVGVDFCEPFIEKAKELNTGYLFEQVDINGFKTNRKFDVVMEVNSLKSLNMTREQFIDKFGGLATKFVMCLEADEFYIKPVYNL